MKENTRKLLGVALVAGFCLLLYANSLWGNFVFDDLHTIPDNLYIKSFHFFPMFFKGYYTSVPDMPAGMFRPLLMLTFAFNYYWSGLAPFGYHLINTLLHFVNAILLLSLLRQLRKNTPFSLALIVSLIFIAHPINTETVAYVSCRSDLLVALLLMGGFLLYTKGRLLFSGIVFALSLLVKETALITLPLLVAYEYIFACCRRVFEVLTRKKTIFFLLLTGVSVAYWVYRMTVYQQNAQDIVSAPFTAPYRSFLANILTQMGVSAFYLRLFVWPYPLNLHHMVTEPSSLLQPYGFFAAIFFVLMGAAVIALRKREPLVSFGIVWYMIGFLPKMYGVLHFPAMEHHFYVPGIGIYFVLLRIFEPLYARHRRKFLIGICGLLCVFTVLVWERNYEWRSSLILYKVAVKRDPASAVAHNNLGIEYSRMGLADAAQAEFRKALSLSRSLEAKINARVNLAHIYMEQRKYREALDELGVALKLKPNYALIYEAIGGVYVRMNDEDNALAAWKEGLRFNPKDAGILKNLGFFYLKKGDSAQAQRYIQKAISLHPNDGMAYLALGQVFEKQHNTEEAIRAYEQAISHNIRSGLAYYCLGTLYAQKLDPRALRLLKEAVRLMPEFASAHNNLAVLYASLEPAQLALAREEARKALALGYAVDPEFLKHIGVVQEGARR